MTLIIQDELEEREQRIERNLRHAWYETALDFKAIRDSNPKLYRREGTGKRGWSTWADYCQERWGRDQTSIDRQIARADEMTQIMQICTISRDQIPATMSHATELAKLETNEQRAEVWNRVLVLDVPITAQIVAGEVSKYKAALAKSYITLAEWNAGERWHGGQSTRPMNEQDDKNIEWAAWSWNPVTGCKHGCPYCYARDIANRFYPHGFEPTFHPDRMAMPANTENKGPRWDGDIGYRNVFVSSMGDLFGNWVPQEWIDAVLEAVTNANQWNFLFLTKNPERLTLIEWPNNAWVGTTVDCQKRVTRAEDAFSRIKAKVKFVSCEPLSEAIIFAHPEYFDWLIIGGRRQSTQLPSLEPQWRWVKELSFQWWAIDRPVYWKVNANARSREYPR